MIRFLCSLLKHPGAQIFMDESGEFEVTDCVICATFIIRDLVPGHQKEDYELVLDRWLIDWKQD